MNSSVYTIIKDLFGITGTDGFSAKEIEQVRNLYGKIPLALELYYREVGRNEQVNQTQNNLIVPWKYSWAKSESHLIIYAENQGVCFWGVSLNDLDCENPPVYVTFDNVNKIEWELESDSLTDFLIAMAHVHAGFALPFATNEIYMITEQGADIIRRHFKMKCKSLKGWVDGGVEIYGNNACDSIVLMRNADDYDMYYASGKEDYFNQMDVILSPLGDAY